MTTRLALITILIAALTTACGSDVDPEYLAEIEAWHAERIDGLRSDTGWLTLAGLHSLNEGTNTIGSSVEADVVLNGTAPDAVGTILIAGSEIIFNAAQGADVRIYGSDEPKPIRTALLRTDLEGDPSVLQVDMLVFHVINRAGEFYLRVKDRESENLKRFEGIERFPVREQWRIEARLEGEPGFVTIPDVLGHENESPTPGVLVFTLDGVEHRLTPQGETGGDMFLVFGDATNGFTTYGAGRFLSISAADAQGRVIVDFNRSVNPPCIFTDYATCPLPPSENILTIAVEAGEKQWGDHH